MSDTIHVTVAFTAAMDVPAEGFSDNAKSYWEQVAVAMVAAMPSFGASGTVTVGDAEAEAGRVSAPLV